MKIFWTIAYLICGCSVAGKLWKKNKLLAFWVLITVINYIGLRWW